MALIVGQLPPDPHWIEAEYEGEIFRVCVDKAVWTLAFDAQFNTIPDDVDAMRGWFRDVFAKLVLTWELAATPEAAAAGTFLPVAYDVLRDLPGDIWAAFFKAIYEAIRLNFPKPAAPSSSGTPTDSPETTDAAPTANASPRRKRKSTNTTSS
jgi:hypothetical protein